MTMYRKQAIPFNQWGYRVSTVAQRNAIADPLTGAFAYVSDDDDLFQYDGTAWQAVTDGADLTKLSFITITQGVDLDQIEADTVANNAKVTNATHTGEVTGSGALTVDKTAITNKTLVTAAVGDHVLIADADDSDNLKKVTVQTIVDLASGGVTDGDKGDITVTGGVWNIDAGVVGDPETGSVYALLAGRAGSQILNGGTAANEDLTLNGTAHATKTSSYVLLQPSGGFVGIGNSAPAAPLEVTGTNSAGVTENIRLNSSLAGSTRDIRVSGTTGGLRFLSTESALTVQPNGASFQMWSNGSGLPGQLYFDSGSHNSAAIVFRTAPTATNIAERMRIMSSGKVGIGTSAPDKILEVNLGTTDAFRLTYNDANGGATTYVDETISSVGLVTFDAVGSAPGFLFNDNVGVGISPTAVLHLKAGTASANTAPLKLTSGTNLTTAEAGAVEYNGTNLFFTRVGTTRQTVLTADVVTTEVVVTDTTITVNINGVDYKLLAKA